MCMRLKNWDKGEVHIAFSQSCDEAYKLDILGHCIKIVLILQKKITLIHRRLYFELINKIIQLFLDYPF